MGHSICDLLFPSLALFSARVSQELLQSLPFFVFMFSAEARWPSSQGAEPHIPSLPRRTRCLVKQHRSSPNSMSGLRDGTVVVYENVTQNKLLAGGPECADFGLRGVSVGLRALDLCKEQIHGTAPLLLVLSPWPPLNRTKP